MKFRSLPKWTVRLTVVVILAAVYYCTGKLGLMLATLPGNVTAVWPPSGINLAVVLLLGYRVWPGIALGSFVSVIENLSTMQPPVLGVVGIAIAISLALGNTLEAVLASFLIRRWCGTQTPLYRTEDVFKFVAAVGMCSRAFGATVGVTALCLSNLAPWNDYGSIWWTWWTSGLVAALVFTPTILIWSRLILNWKNLKFKIQNLKLAEATLLLVLVLIIGLISFGGGYPVVFVFIPLLVWSAFRFGLHGATLSILIISAIAIHGTVKGYGSFVSKNPNESLVLLQSFIGVVALTTLILSAAIAERQQAQNALKKTLDELELRVEERTAALIQANQALQQSEAQFREQATQLELALRELQQTQTQLIQTEKMSSLGELVAGIAHEINNPVNFIYGNFVYANQYVQNLIRLVQLYQMHYPYPKAEIQQEVENLELDYILEDLPKLLSSMKIGAERIRQIVLSLRNFSRLDEAEMKSVDIHEGIDSTLLILQHRLHSQAGARERGAKHSCIKVIKEYSQLPKVECYPGQLNQVFMNILSNAIDALEEDKKYSVADSEKSATLPTIRIRTGVLDTYNRGRGCEGDRSYLVKADRVIIEISDNGNGMTEDVKKRLFNPFFTTKPVGKGTGLGLAISYQIVVEKHHGELKYDSNLGQGTEFLIEIPIQQNHLQVKGR